MTTLTLQSDEVERAAGVIARAFHEDALLVHLFPDAATRARLAPVLFAPFIRYDHLFGTVDQVADFAAVASWASPGDELTSTRRGQAGFDALTADIPMKTLERVFDHVDAAVSAAASGLHWHLRLLGVEPRMQGSGLGAALLRHGLDRAAATGHPVVLETFSHRSVSFYVRNGFELLVDAVEPSSEVRFWVLSHPHDGRASR